MAVIKGKEKVVNKPASPVNINKPMPKLSEKTKKKLLSPRNCQPIPTVCVS